MAIRYRVLDLPAKGVGAFLPTPSTNPVASSQGEVVLSGAPGTEPQPALGPTRVWCPTPNNAPQLQGSNVAPDLWLYDKYIPYADNMGPSADAGLGMASRRLNPLPVPAVNVNRIAGPAFNTMRMGGRETMAWPRAFQRFPTCRTRIADS